LTANFCSSFGNLSISKQNRHIIAILEFIETYIEKYIFVYKEEYSDIEIETGITQELCSYFESKINEHPFYFHHEDRTNPVSGQSPTVDFSAKTRVPFGKFRSRQTIFSIEAKRLPTPGSGREKEYVIGHTNSKDKYITYGGIERFKKGIHGKRLSHSAILGYIQKEDFQYWFKQVNTWINELIIDDKQEIEWNQNDKLIRLSLNSRTAKFQSVNKRENDSITIFHYWLNLVNDIMDDDLINNAHIIIVE